MGADFRFLYSPDAPAEDGQYEVPVTTSDFFVSLFDVDTEAFEAEHMLSSFVREYQEDMPRAAMYWQSSPFAPAEARLWAQQWLEFLHEAAEDREVLALVFPYAVDLQGRSTLQVDQALEDLNRVVAQAACAERHDAQLCVEVEFS